MVTIVAEIKRLTVGMVLIMDSSRFAGQCQDKTNPKVKYHNSELKANELSGSRPHIIIEVNKAAGLATVIPCRSTCVGPHCIPFRFAHRDKDSYLDILNMKAMDLFILNDAEIAGIVDSSVVCEIRKGIANYYCPSSTITTTVDNPTDSVEEQEETETVVEDNHERRKYAKYNYPEVTPSDIRVVNPKGRLTTVEQFIQYFEHFNKLGKERFLKEYCITAVAVSHRVRAFNEKFGPEGYNVTREGGKIIITSPEKDKIDASKLTESEDIHRMFNDFNELDSNVFMDNYIIPNGVDIDIFIKNAIFILNNSRGEYKYKYENNQVSWEPRLKSGFKHQ